TRPGTSPIRAVGDRLQVRKSPRPNWPGARMRTFDEGKEVREGIRSVNAEKSVQPRPVQNADVLAGHVEALCEKRPQLARARAALNERYFQLHHPAPFTARMPSPLGDGRACSDEVGVVLGGHGNQA